MVPQASNIMDVGLSEASGIRQASTDKHKRSSPRLVVGYKRQEDAILEGGVACFGFSHVASLVFCWR